MKEVRQCKNQHRFCYSCIFVWSTSGNPVNHDRCPVCRTEGDYVRNHDLDTQINLQRVKCPMKSCYWTGLLKYLPSHQHTTYNKLRPGDSPRQPLTEPENIPDLPPVTNAVRSRPSSRSEPGPSSSTTPRTRIASSSQTNTRLPLSSISSNVQNEQRQSVSTNTSSRTRTRSRHRHSSTSPQRRSNVTATGLNRLTSRTRIQNDGTTVSSETTNTGSGTATGLAPRPPPGPRPNGRSPRRMPTLPSIVHNNTSNTATNNGTSDQNVTVQTDINNNSDAAVTTTEIPLGRETARAQRQFGRPRGFGMIRDRLNESRQRLDMLMGAFSVELDRGRRDLTEFQEERERRRTEQLQEVQELGRRLGHVAQELRGLLNQRTQIREQINLLADPIDEDFD